jgi:hypothetical protein
VTYCGNYIHYKVKGLRQHSINNDYSSNSLLKRDNDITQILKIFLAMVINEKYIVKIEVGSQKVGMNL